MQDIILENTKAKLFPIALNKHHFLKAIAKEANLLQYSPSKIDTPNDLTAYVEMAID